MRPKSDEDEKYLEWYHILYTFCFLQVIHDTDKMVCAKQP